MEVGLSSKFEKGSQARAWEPEDGGRNEKRLHSYAFDTAFWSVIN